uniref:Uncharacterized protein n=1 Tax=Ananas comosus var. bracteatus TaxID=296719 RepID=A0A6V7PEP7_ANACO|nr:unnamed protein product [Ananas comosus var. bracteatus]
MANAWRRDKPSSLSSHKTLIFLFSIFLILFLIFLFYPCTSNPSPSRSAPYNTLALAQAHARGIRPYDCLASPQASPVFASLVEGVRYPFLFSSPTSAPCRRSRTRTSRGC